MAPVTVKRFLHFYPIFSLGLAGLNPGAQDVENTKLYEIKCTVTELRV